MNDFVNMLAEFIGLQLLSCLRKCCCLSIWGLLGSSVQVWRGTLNPKVSGFWIAARQRGVIKGSEVGSRCMAF